MPAALPLTNMISQASSMSREYKTKTAEFGNGYSQDIPDGINWKRDTWNVVYENLTDAEYTTLTGVLDAVGSWDILTWTPIGSSTQKKFKVTSDGWSASMPSGTHWNISFTLKQRY